MSSLCALEDSLKAKKATPDPKAAADLTAQKAAIATDLQDLENANATCYNRTPRPLNTGCGGPCGWEFVVESCLVSKEAAVEAYGGVVGDDIIKKFWQRRAMNGAKGYYTGSKPIENLSESEKQKEFESNVSNTIGILLYEFATGTGETKRTFNSPSPYAEALKNTLATDEALMYFYRKHFTSIETITDCLRCIEINDSYYFPFSPNKTIASKGFSEGLRETINKHFSVLSPPNDILITRGGMFFNFKLDEKREFITVSISDAYTYESLSLHAGNSFERIVNKITPLGTTRVRINFQVQFRLDGYQFYKNKVDDVLNK